MHFHANDSNLCQFHWKINCPHLNIVITISTFSLYFVVYTVRYTANSALWFNNFYFPFVCANWTTHGLGSKIFFYCIHCFHKKRGVKRKVFMESHFIINMSFNCQNNKKHDQIFLLQFMPPLPHWTFLQLKKSIVVHKFTIHLNQMCMWL